MESKSKSKSRKKFRKLVCGPKTRKKKNKTCFHKDDLLFLKQEWNKRNPSQMIKSSNMYTIRKQLKQYMSNICEHERCWLTSILKERNINSDLFYRFAPTRPSSWNNVPRQWLTNHDIKKVMNQYEYYYPEFTFIGPSPINYDDLKYSNTCVWEELCNFSLDKYLGTKTSIGIIFNTDVHTGPGKHWIAIFINIKKEYIYYFDSGNQKMPLHVVKLMDTIQDQGLKYNIHFEKKQNVTKHQKGYSECGMYCLHFIISLLKGKPLSYFKRRIPDNKVFALRKLYFNKY